MTNGTNGQLNVYIETYGCQMNVYDSEMIAGLLTKTGYQQTMDLSDADVILVNTCAIRDHAEQRVIGRLGQLNKYKLMNPDVVVGVLGCMSQRIGDRLLGKSSYLDLAVGTDQYDQLPQLIQNVRETHVATAALEQDRTQNYVGILPKRNMNSVNAFVTIMRGCNNYCTFCIVPMTRGRERSRSIPDIIHEVEVCVANGFKEITLLGQNVNSYRSEKKERFPELLEAVAAVNGVKRIRFTSPHPKDATDRMFEVMGADNAVCESLHLPVQSGSTRILKAMRRRHTKEEFIEKAMRAYEMIPGLAMSTDIIVGFPGETDADFEDTLDVVRQVRFHSAYTFKYSPRENTPAYEMEDTVPETVKQERLEALIDLQRQITQERLQEMVGKTYRILVEKTSKKRESQLFGRTRNNQPVVFDGDASLIGEFVPVKATGVRGITLVGERVSET